VTRFPANSANAIASELFDEAQLVQRLAAVHHRFHHAHNARREA
jgi:hypothetical protein